MRSFIGMAAMAASVLLSPATQAAEPLAAYDKFSDRPLDPQRWVDSERARYIKAGALYLMQRSWGFAGADVGVVSAAWNDSFTNPGTITAIQARVTVQAMEINTCPANPAIADSRVRIIGGFFNVGIPTPGSQLGDVTAQVRLIRASNSADAPGVLRVQGVVVQCTTPDCLGGVNVGNVVEMGTVSVGTPTTVQMQWDQAAKTFTFARDGGAYGGTVGYALSDASPPSVLFRQLSTRMVVPNCQSAPRVNGFVEARFDNVFVNASAAP
jgi:hypothetical protein